MTTQVKNAPSSMLAAPRSPMRTPVDASSGLQLIPRFKLAAASPPIANGSAVICGISAQGPSRNQVTYAAARPASVSRRARCSADARAVWIVSMTSAVAVPVGNGELLDDDQLVAQHRRQQDPQQAETDRPQRRATRAYRSCP